MWTMNQVYGMSTPEAARQYNKLRVDVTDHSDDLESWAIHNVGPIIYEKLIKNYSQKQWGRTCSELPASIIKRLPIRYTWNNDYFSDEFQGMPVGGYSAMIERMLDGIEVRLGIDYLNANTAIDYQTQAWCSDYTEDLSGEVGTVEVPGLPLIFRRSS